MCNLIQNSLIIYCDIHQPPKCLYLEHVRCTPSVHQWTLSWRHLWLVKIKFGRRSNGNFGLVTGANSEYNSLWWRHNGHDGVSNHQSRHCLLSRLFGCRSKKTSKLCVTGLCAGNSPETGEFPAQMASNAENGPIWWRHHVIQRHDTNNYLTCFYHRCRHSLF